MKKIFAEYNNTMTHGKRTCRILKEIRQQIADKNDIEYVTSECNFQGECEGTCPKYESELKYLENELNKRRQLGKVVAVAGISLGIVGIFSACNSPLQKRSNTTSEQEIVQEMPEIEIIPDKSKSESLIMICGNIDEAIDGEVLSKPPDEILPIEDDVEDTSNFPDIE